MTDTPDIAQLKLDAVLWFGPVVTAFNQEYFSREGELFVITDIETKDYIIVIDTNHSSLSERLQRINFINQSVYEAGKAILCLVSDKDFEQPNTKNILFFNTLPALFDHVIKNADIS